MEMALPLPYKKHGGTVKFLVVKSFPGKLRVFLPLSPFLFRSQNIGLMEKPKPTTRKALKYGYRILCLSADNRYSRLETTETLEEAMSIVQEMESRFRGLCELLIYEVVVTESVRLVYGNTLIT
jgi:hypothetical protein